MKTCCFFGHRKISETNSLSCTLYGIIENLIIRETVSCFLFGSKSEFDTLCYSVVSELKNKYPNIKRIYVRAEYPIISEDYKNYLLQDFEDTYFPEGILNAGRTVYIKRNCEMIDNSDYCVIYYSDCSSPNTNRKSGTKIALDYASSKNKHIINVF